MKYLKFGIIIFALCIFSCDHDRKLENRLTINPVRTRKSSEALNAKQEIQNLIRKALIWSESKNSINLLPVIVDYKDSTYVGFDVEKLKVNLEKLKETDFFSARFIENYNQIILTLDKKLRNKEFDKWMIGDLPTFSFANDVDPWCACQDNLSWNLVEVEIISLNNSNGELYWKWGKTELDKSFDDWKHFTYFRLATKDFGLPPSDLIGQTPSLVDRIHSYVYYVDLKRK